MADKNLQGNKYIREYQEQDFEQVLQILQKPGGHHITEEPEQMRKNLNENKVFVYEDGVIKGFTFIEPSSAISQIILYVDPEERRKGIGSLLWDFSVEELQELDPPTTWVFFRQDVGNSRAFYASKGCKDWYAYHHMNYTGPKFPKSQLETRKFDLDFFDDYLRERAEAFMEVNKSIKVIPMNEMERKDEIYQWAQQQKDNIFLYYLDDLFIGSAAIANDSLIDEVFVCKHAQGQGYSKLIVHDIVNQIIDKGLEPTLCVVTGNEKAIALYRKVGFNLMQTLEMNRKFHPTKEPDLRGPIG